MPKIFQYPKIRLRQERSKRGWTIVEVASRLKIHPSTISNLECGRWKPWRKISKKLERLFGVPADILFSEIQEGGNGQ